MAANDTTHIDRHSSGRQAEALASRFLASHGLAELARNYRCRGGEIDLVCRDGKVLVFVEVRLRRHAAYGGAAASITLGKRRRLLLAAQHYLAAHGKNEADCRFDCLLLDALDENRILWMKNAFAAD